MNKYRYTLSNYPVWQPTRPTSMKRITKLSAKIAYIVTLFTTMASMGFIGLYLAVGPDLPEVETIRQIKIQTPMSIYSKDGQLINEFGDIRRIPITLDQVPQDFINALLSTEDSRFYEHSGVDIVGVLRAVVKLATTQTKSQGASTITMLVARNYYLTREKRFSRKFTEMFVAWKLESELTKDEILEIFLNKIEWGHRSRGIAAAAQVYYGKTLNQLNLAQLATLAGIPKGQSVFNPISRPDKALTRRSHVLGRMLTEGHINQSQFDEANSQPIKTTRHGAKITVNANYIAEMVHRDLIQQFGRDSAHGDGLRVFTSLDPKLQKHAQEALRTGLLEYDRRHGFRPVEQHFEIDESTKQEDLIEWISDFQQIGQLVPALVVKTEQSKAEILIANGSRGVIHLEDSLWARKYIDENHREYGKLKDITQIFVVGDVIRVLATDKFEVLEKPSNKESSGDAKGKLSETPLNSENPETAETIEIPEAELPTKGLPIYMLSQIPDVNAGFVVLNPQNGAIEALVGGFNFSKNQFNMVTQARRQLGSNIKPFVYSSALEKGFTAASLINDSPIINWDSSAGTFWRPENDSGRYRGPMRLREALRLSVNTVSIRLIQKVGPAYTKKYLENIGFPGRHMQPFESLALGSASFTPLEVATGYAVLANGGFKVAPWYIQRIEDSRGKILFEQQPMQVCIECIEILAEQEKAKQEAELLAEMEFAELSVLNNDASISNSETSTDSAQIQKTALSGTTIDDENISQSALLIDHNKTIKNYPLLPVAIEKIAPRVIDERNLFIIDSLLKDVIHRGTAWRNLNTAKSPLLKRSDVAGKTGTTNESKDAWFSGYNSRLVASAWVGFVDHSKKLGKREFGAKAALPIWRRFMEKALDGMPQISLPRPEGIVEVKIDLKNGKLASVNTEKSEFEVFRVENVPTEYSEAVADNPWEHLDEKKQQQLEQDDEATLDELEL